MCSTSKKQVKSRYPTFPCYVTSFINVPITVNIKQTKKHFVIVLICHKITFKPIKFSFSGFKIFVQNNNFFLRSINIPNSISVKLTLCQCKTMQLNSKSTEVYSTVLLRYFRRVLKQPGVILSVLH